MTDQRTHAVVIGSGFGGLGAAVRLAARGYRVTVLEKDPQPGGRARGYEQDGFRFDAGPTVVTAPQLLEELWTLAGRRFEDDVDLRPVDPYYRIRFHDGVSFDYVGDMEEMKRQIASFSPADAEGYERFMAASREVFDIGFTELAHVPFGSWGDMARVIPPMIRLGSYRSVYSMVAKYIRDDRLRQVLSFHTLLVGGNPFTTSSIYTLIPCLERMWGVHFPMGGVHSLVRGIVGLVEHLGGEVRCEAEVEQITVEEGRATGVRLVGGEEIPAAVVVSNADPGWTYGQLVAPEHRRRWTDRKLARVKYSMSLFVWYFGTNRRYEDVAHHSILLGPRYRALLDDIFHRHVLADDFSLYLHRGTATDPSLAPDGCDAFYVLSPVPNLRGKTDWAEAAEGYRARIEDFLAGSVLPGLGDAIVTSRMTTPLTFRDELLSPHGAAFSFEPRLTQSAYFRPHNRSEDVEGLYIVGAGTHPGAGIPGVLSSARVLDSVVPDPE